jgi:pyroglutamyl-peptidase
MAFIVTGFGPFLDIKENPTSILADACMRHLPSLELRILHSRVVPVGFTAVEANIDEIYSLINARRAEDPRENIIVLHLGLHSGTQNYELECQAVNECDIGSDVAGECKFGPVDDLRGSGEAVCCRLDVEGIASRLRESGFPVVCSSYAGLYLCNYIYYKSLVKAESAGVTVLFVHMPDFATIPEAEQLNFIGELCVALKDSLS